MKTPLLPILVGFVLFGAILTTVLPSVKWDALKSDPLGAYEAKPRYAKTYPVDVAASLEVDCEAEIEDKLVCTCYAWKVMDKWTFKRVMLMYARDPRRTKLEVSEVYEWCRLFHRQALTKHYNEGGIAKPWSPKP